MTGTTLALLLIFAAGAGFIQRVTGFGYSIFIMTLLPHIMPSYGEATALSGMLAMVGVCVTGYRVRNHFVLRKFILITATCLVVSFFAVRIVRIADGVLLKHILGGVLIAASFYFIFINGRLSLKPGARTQLALGTLSGLMGGLFSMQGPPAVVYFLSCTQTKEEYLALTSFYFVVCNFVTTIVRAFNGLVTETVCKTWLMAVPAIFVGLFAGELVWKKMPIELLRKCVYVYIGVAGAVALAS